MAPSAPSDARTQGGRNSSAIRPTEDAAARSVRGGARGMLGRRGVGAPISTTYNPNHFKAHKADVPGPVAAAAPPHSVPATGFASRSAGRATPTPADQGGLSGVPSAGPGVTLASAGPSVARTQAAALGGAEHPRTRKLGRKIPSDYWSARAGAEKMRPALSEDAARRSVSAAARGAVGPAEGTHGCAAVKALACGSASLRALRVTAAQPGGAPVLERRSAVDLLSLAGVGEAPRLTIPNPQKSALDARQPPTRVQGTTAGTASHAYPNSSSAVAVAVSALDSTQRAPMASAGSSDARTQRGPCSSATGVDRGQSSAPIRRRQWCAVGRGAGAEKETH
jgi:hypothetical protein